MSRFLEELLAENELVYIQELVWVVLRRRVNRLHEHVEHPDRICAGQLDCWVAEHRFHQLIFIH